jgi:hypothetical protein
MRDRRLAHREATAETLTTHLALLGDVLEDLESAGIR